MAMIFADFNINQTDFSQKKGLLYHDYYKFL
jgi:hypothetical protein